MKENQIKIGLNIPLFTASLFTLFVGTFTGLLGVWIYLTWGIAVPEYVKVGHAHTSWWSVLILLSALFLPSLALKPISKRFIVWSAFLAPILWQFALAIYYISKVRRGAIDPVDTAGVEFGLEYLVYGTGIFVMEVWLFFALGLVVLSGTGMRIPYFSQAQAAPSNYELVSDVEIPRSLFWFPIAFGGAGLMLGWYITLLFTATGKPIDPAALVQFHCHLFFYVVGYFLTLMTLRSVGASKGIFDTAHWLGFLGIPAIFIGYLLFINLEWHSLVYVLPSSLYYIMMVIGLIGLCGVYGLKKRGESFHYVRGCMIFGWSVLLILIALGPIIALVWDTHPNLTVTYKQPPSQPYPGPYPETYIGTQDVGMTPRGLENAHLSPSSWYHVALLWLLVLLLFGEEMCKRLGKKNLIYLIATTVAVAPFFNAVGRFAAWLKLPNGIGTLYFAGQPLKMFSIVLLLVMACILLYQIKRDSKIRK